MFYYLESLPWLEGSAIIMLFFVIISCGAILCVRRFVDPRTLKGHHDVAAVVFTNLGVLYSVLLGFTVVNVQQRFDQTEGTIQTEASYLAQLYLDAEVFPAPHQQDIRRSIREYVVSVIEVEWKLMGYGIKSQETIEKLRKIWANYYAFIPATEQQRIWYTQSINRLNELMQARMSRIIGSHESLSEEMWSLLIAGGILMGAFMCFFGLENPWVHILLGATLAATSAFLLFLIYSLDTAFSGQASITPEALERILGSFGQLEAGPLNSTGIVDNFH